MFETPNQQPGMRPASGPLPGEPLQPMASSVPGAPVTPLDISPERSPSMPPPFVPPTLPSSKKPGGRRRRLLLVLVLVLLLLGGGAAVAALLFPGTTPTNDANTVVANLTNRSNTNVANTNLNRSNANVVANANLPATNTANQNSNTNLAANANQNVNTVVNTNTAANENVNTSTNTNTPPSTYSVDTDGDKLNNYLEQWLGTSATNADSDGDSFPDGGEVTSKYSPLGDGTLNANDFSTFCTRSTVVLQYGLSSADITTLCTIGSDLLTSIQVMASNSQFFEDLDAQLATRCTAFGKIDKGVCTGLIPFVLVDYMVSG